MRSILNGNIKSRRFTLSIYVKFLSLAICTFLLSACAIPQIIVNPDISAESIKDYKVIYIPTPDSDEDDPRNIFPKVIEKLGKLGFIVRPVNKENPIGGAQGSGFIIDSKGFVITSAHLFKSEKIASVWIKGERYKADVVDTNEEKDLALLKISEHQTSNFKPLQISKNIDYKMGQSVYTIGFPLSRILGNSPRLNSGLISSTVGLKDNPDYLQISVEVQPGNSGSPLLNEDGAVVGIIQSTLNPMSVLAGTDGALPQNVNFAAKASIIEKFIAEGNSNISISRDHDSPIKLEFDKVSDSVVQIHAGYVTEEQLKQPKMVCRVAYLSYLDIWYKFKLFNLEFYDLETGKLLFKAGQYGDNTLNMEDTVINQTIEQIRNQFHLQAGIKNTGS